MAYPESISTGGGRLYGESGAEINIADEIESIADGIESSQGQSGGMLITDTAAHTGTWRKMLVLSDAAFTTLTSTYTKNGATPAVAADWGTLPAGTILSGVFTAVTLTSGSVLMVA